MAEEDHRMKLKRYWSDIFRKIVSEFRTLQENCATNEELTDTENFPEITFYEPDLGIYCIKNRNLINCESTLNAITKRIEFIVHFNNPLRRRANEICERIKADLMVLLTIICKIAFRIPPLAYGSFDNELCCFESNINFHIEYDYANAGALWMQICEKLRNARFKFTDVEMDTTNSELLLKMLHEDTNIETVISFTDQMRLRNATLMKIFSNMNPNVKPLVLFLKHILALHDLHGRDKITTYQLFWLITYYFQRKKLLPAVKDLRAIATEPKHYIDDKWNCTLPDPNNISFTSSNLLNETAASLFLGFVGFYKNFDFLRYVMSPYVGHAIPIYDFDTWAIPMDAEDAAKHSNQVGKPLFIKHVVNYQDPTILHRNLFSSVPNEVINSFKFLCKFLYRYYHSTIFRDNDFDIDLPIVLIIDSPIALVQSASIVFNAEALSQSYDLNGYVIFTIRIMMENLLKFSLVNITSKMENKRNGSITVVYFDYCLDSRNCNTVTSLILNRKLQSYKPGYIKYCTPERFKNKLFRIYIVCEIYNKSKIKLFMEGTARLVGFLKAHGQDLLQYILSQLGVQS